jgi:hypothetical protein
MIIDFDFDLKEDTEFEHTISPEDARKWDKHQGKVVNLIGHYEKKFGFTRSGMTSWAKVSATAFLDDKQIDKLVKDKRVTLLTENEYISFSANPPYGNSVVGNEFRSWGYQATNGKSGYSPASGRDVYVIDGGVAVHTDLPNVASRVNVSCGSGGNCSIGGTSDEYPPIGCNPHATHVAGIIGARGNGSVTNAGGAGVYDGVRIHSVAVRKAQQYTSSVGVCANVAPSPSIDAIGYALDYVYTQIMGPPPSYINNGVAVVNMSINPGRLGFTNTGQTETNRQALLKLVNPATVWVYDPFGGTGTNVSYPGAFFVQSAGNSSNATNAVVYDTQGGRNICNQFASNGGSIAYTHAYPNNNTTSASDGIMVVGAIHHDGAAADKGATPSVPLSGIWDSAGLRALSDHSSHYGPCVDVWAPGNLIYSTWGSQTEPNGFLTRVGVTYSANQTASTNGWAFLSGTSMAAPHVAGAAAWLADTNGLTTPAQIEQAVRNRFKQLYYTVNGSSVLRKDRSNTNIKIVELP